jgi:hypothetical protein
VSGLAILSRGEVMPQRAGYQLSHDNLKSTADILDERGDFEEYKTFAMLWLTFLAPCRQILEVDPLTVLTVSRVLHYFSCNYELTSISFRVLGTN